MGVCIYLCGCVLFLRFCCHIPLVYVLLGEILRDSQGGLDRVLNICLMGRRVEFGFVLFLLLLGIDEIGLIRWKGGRVYFLES